MTGEACHVQGQTIPVKFKTSNVSGLATPIEIMTLGETQVNVIPSGLSEPSDLPPQRPNRSPSIDQYLPKRNDSSCSFRRFRSSAPPQIPRRHPSKRNINDSGLGIQKKAMSGPMIAVATTLTTPSAFWNTEATSMDSPPKNIPPLRCRVRQESAEASLSMLWTGAHIESSASFLGLAKAQTKRATTTTPPPHRPPPPVLPLTKRPINSDVYDTGLVSLSGSPICVSDDKMTIERNLRSRIRGVHETWACIQRDFYLPICCRTCSVELCCIRNVDFVLCPTCGVLNSTEGVSKVRGGGAGVGFTLQDLKNWESG